MTDLAMEEQWKSRSDVEHERRAERDRKGSMNMCKKDHAVTWQWVKGIRRVTSDWKRVREWTGTIKANPEAGFLWHQDREKSSGKPAEVSGICRKMG